MKTFLDTSGLQKFTSHTVFWKKLMNVERHQNKRVNQEKGKYGGKEKAENWR